MESHDDALCVVGCPDGQSHAHLHDIRRVPPWAPGAALAAPPDVARRTLALYYFTQTPTTPAGDHLPRRPENGPR